MRPSVESAPFELPEFKNMSPQAKITALRAIIKDPSDTNSYPVYDSQASGNGIYIYHSKDGQTQYRFYQDDEQHTHIEHYDKGQVFKTSVDFSGKPKASVGAESDYNEEIHSKNQVKFSPGVSASAAAFSSSLHKETIIANDTGSAVEFEGKISLLKAEGGLDALKLKEGKASAGFDLAKGTVSCKYIESPSVSIHPDHPEDLRISQNEYGVEASAGAGAGVNINIKNPKDVLNVKDSVKFTAGFSGSPIIGIDMGNNEYPSLLSEQDHRLLQNHAIRSELNGESAQQLLGAIALANEGYIDAQTVQSVELTDEQRGHLIGKYNDNKAVLENNFGETVEEVDSFIQHPLIQQEAPVEEESGGFLADLSAGVAGLARTAGIEPDTLQAVGFSDDTLSKAGYETIATTDPVPETPLPASDPYLFQGFAPEEIVPDNESIENSISPAGAINYNEAGTFITGTPVDEVIGQPAELPESLVTAGPEDTADYISPVYGSSSFPNEATAPAETDTPADVPADTSMPYNAGGTSGTNGLPGESGENTLPLDPGLPGSGETPTPLQDVFNLSDQLGEAIDTSMPGQNSFSTAEDVIQGDIGPFDTDTATTSSLGEITPAIEINSPSLFDGTGPETTFDGTGAETTLDGTGPEATFDGGGTESTYDGTGTSTTFDGTGTESTFEGTGAETTFDGTGSEATFDGTGTESTFDGTGAETTFDGTGYETSFDGGTSSSFDSSSGSSDAGDSFGTGSGYDAGSSETYDAGGSADDSSGTESGGYESGYSIGSDAAGTEAGSDDGTGGDDGGGESGGYESGDSGGGDTGGSDAGSGADYSTGGDYSGGGDFSSGGDAGGSSGGDVSGMAI